MNKAMKKPKSNTLKWEFKTDSVTDSILFIVPPDNKQFSLKYMLKSGKSFKSMNSNPSKQNQFEI
jgi:hypothetical protein